MDDSILAKFPDDDHVLGPFLGNLPPEILDVVVQKLGWFQTTFAMAGRTCREAVERVPSTRAVITEEEREQMDISWETPPLAVAVVEGDVEAMEWLIQRYDPEIEDAIDWWHHLGWLAAKHGKIESLKCLRANSCPWELLTCEGAAEGGHLKVLKWARQNGCEWDESTCVAAAGSGHLKVLKWARRNECPWDENTCVWAAREGHLEVLQWAHRNGCPWDHDVWSSAHPRCRPYLIYHGCPGLE